MTTNLYLVKIAEMNKAADEAEDRPSIARGALVGAGWGAGIGAGAGLASGHYIGGQMASGMPEGLSIGRKVRNGAKMGLKGEITPTGSAPVERMSNRIARTSERAGKYLTRHPVRGGRAMFTGLMGGVGLAAGSLAGASSGASVQVARRLMDKEAGDTDSSPSYLAGLGVGAGVGAGTLGAMAHRQFTKGMIDPDSILPENLRGMAPKREVRREMVKNLKSIDLLTDGQPVDPKHPLKHLRSMVTKKNAMVGGILGGAVGLGVQGVRNAMHKEAVENRYLAKIAEVDQEPLAARVGRHMTTGVGVGAWLGTLLGTSAVLQGRGSLLVPPALAAAGALTGAAAGVGTGTFSGVYRAHRDWEAAHQKAAEEIPGYFNTVGRWAGGGAQIGSMAGAGLGTMDGIAAGIRRGNGVLGKAVGAVTGGLTRGLAAGGAGAVVGGGIGGGLGGVAGTVNLARKGVRAISE